MPQRPRPTVPTAARQPQRSWLQHPTPVPGPSCRRASIPPGPAPSGLWRTARPQEVSVGPVRTRGAAAGSGTYGCFNNTATVFSAQKSVEGHEDAMGIGSAGRCPAGGVGCGVHGARPRPYKGRKSCSHQRTRQPLPVGKHAAHFLVPADPARALDSGPVPAGQGFPVGRGLGQQPVAPAGRCTLA